MAWDFCWKLVNSDCCWRSWAFKEWFSLLRLSCFFFAISDLRSSRSAKIGCSVCGAGISACERGCSKAYLRISLALCEFILDGDSDLWVEPLEAVSDCWMLKMLWAKFVCAIIIWINKHGISIIAKETTRTHYCHDCILRIDYLHLCQRPRAGVRPLEICPGGHSSDSRRWAGLALHRYDQHEI